MLQHRRIKVAHEFFYDHPAPWSDDEINKQMKKDLFWNCYANNIIWCHENEELFDNPIMCDNFVAPPLKDGYIRIKEAIEQYDVVPYEWSKEYIEKILKHTSEYCNARSFIWCYEDEELFKED